METVVKVLVSSGKAFAVASHHVPAPGDQLNQMCVADMDKKMTNRSSVDDQPNTAAAP
jgi:hypothetical protein